MSSAHFVLTAGWILYCALHSILADNRVKGYVLRMAGKQFKFYRFGYSLLSILLLFPLVNLQFHMRSPQLFEPGPVIYVISAMLACTGLAGILVSLKKYIASPQGFRDLFLEGEKPELQIKGFHRMVRHPLYLSTFMLIWGVFLFKPLLSILLVNLVITIYTLIAIRFEENKLLLLYGNAYKEYKEKVPKILPRFLTR